LAGGWQLLALAATQAGGMNTSSRVRPWPGRLLAVGALVLTIGSHAPVAAAADTLQQTTTGLAFSRASTNTPTFTDGANHWAHGCFGQCSTRPTARRARPV
jgi:hypothetical protein